MILLGVIDYNKTPWVDSIMQKKANNEPKSERRKLFFTRAFYALKSVGFLQGFGHLNT